LGLDSTAFFFVERLVSAQFVLPIGLSDQPRPSTSFDLQSQLFVRLKVQTHSVREGRYGHGIVCNCITKSRYSMLWRPNLHLHRLGPRGLRTRGNISQLSGPMRYHVCFIGFYQAFIRTFSKGLPYLTWSISSLHSSQCNTRAPRLG
jgi:hypothetical protein